MYYLKSGFYDPVTGRFINADDVDVLKVEQGSLNQYNQYAYCLNSPVNGKDFEGQFAISAFAVVSVALIGGAIGALEAVSKGEDWRKAAAFGALSGAVSGAALSFIAAKGASWALGKIVGVNMGTDTVAMTVRAITPKSKKSSGKKKKKKETSWAVTARDPRYYLN